jgi:hypothetical protein
MSLAHMWSLVGVRISGIYLATRKLETGDLDGSVDIIGDAIDSALRAATCSGSAMRPPSWWKRWWNAEPVPTCAPRNQRLTDWKQSQ